MISLILAKKDQDKGLYIYKEIERRLEAGQKSILIVPEQYTLETDIDFINNISFSSVMDAKVLSFSSFAAFFLDRIGKSKLKFLNKEGKLMILTNIMHDLNDKLTLFKNSYGNIDFINSITDIIASFKDNNFDQEFFESIKDAEIDEASRIKFEEIRLILDAYQEALSGKFIDSEDMTSLLAESIKDADFLKDYHFYFDKFEYMEERKLELISALAREDIDITIGLNLDPKNLNEALPRAEIFDPAFGFYKKLRSNFKCEILEIEEAENKADLDHLLDNFDIFNPRPYLDKPNNIRVLESISTRTEVENIALLINKLIKTKDLRYNDFAIYMTENSEYENILAKTFDRYDIPIFLDKRRKMSDNHIIKTFLALLRLRVNKFRKEDLYYILNSKLIDFGKNGEEDCHTFVKFIGKRNIAGAMFEDEKYFILDYDFYEKFLANDPKKEEKLKKKEEEYKAINRVRDKILELLENLDNEGKMRDLLEGIYKMISDSSIRAAITSFQEELKDLAALDDYRENEQIWDKFIEILDQLVLIMGDRQTSLARIYSLIEAVTKDIKIGLIPPSKDHLIVSDFKRERVSNKKINIILGLNDAYFPSGESKDFIINDDEKEDLKRRGIDLKLYDRDMESLEKLSLYKISVGSDKLIFSYALADKSGKELKKSLVLNDILNIFPQMQVKSITKLEPSLAAYSKEGLKKFALENLEKIKKNEKISKEDLDLSLDFIKYLKDNLEKTDNKKIYDSIFKGLFFTNDKDPLNLDLAGKLYGKRAYSVSEIETYSRCPYKYFISYGLRPDVENDFDIDQMEIGNIVHKSLEELSRLLKEENIDDITDEKLDKLLEENFKEGIDLNLEALRKDSPKNAYILENMLNSAKRNAREIKRGLKRSDFKLFAFEESFDKGGFFDQVDIDGENYLRGRIDRIDKAGDLIRIIDYKTGAKSFKLVNVLNGLDLQLIVYMMAASDKDFKPVASFYLPLRDEIEKMDKVSLTDQENLKEILADKFQMTGLLLKVNEEVIRLMDRDYDKDKLAVFDPKKNEIVSPEDFEILTDFAKDLIKQIIENIKKGLIDLRPVRENKQIKECTYCDYRGICKFDEIIDSDRFRDIDKSLKIEDIKRDAYDRD